MGRYIIRRTLFAIPTLDEVAEGNVDVTAPMVWVCGPVVDTMPVGVVETAGVSR